MIRSRRLLGLGALLVVAVLVLTGCNQGGGSGPVSLRESRNAEVQALWFATGPDGPFGGTSRVKVTVEPNSDNELRVGFFESEVGGSGPMWRAAGWMAVVMSSLLLGLDISDYKFTIDVAGRIDGPSAGALMTVTTLSLLLGDKVKPDASMTGTINPDGTIGPIGGIPQKLEGASKAGKKLILIPLGQRYDRDAKTGQMVDTVERGQRLGVEVREVGDIYEAYQALTGSALPKPEGAADAQPELTTAAFEKVKSKAKEWMSRFEQERGTFNSMEARFRQPFGDLVRQAATLGARADSYAGQGSMASAFSKALEATLFMTIATEGARLVNIYVNQGPAAAEQRLKSVQSVQTRVDGLIDRLKVEKPTNATQAIVLANAFGEVTLAIGLITQAEDVLRTKPKTPQQRQEFLFTAALYYAVANHVAQLANDVLDIGLGESTGTAPDPKRLDHYAEILRRAAEANLTYFDAVVIDEIAKGRGVHPDAVRTAFRTIDFDYAFALATINALPFLKDKVGGGEPASYATLGGALASYQFSSALVAKHYSLNVKMNQGGTVVGVGNERAMIRMLDFAEKRARELIALAKSTGNTPSIPIVYYDDGKVDREGTVADKIGALQSFWTSSLEAELMAIFSGKFQLKR